MTTEQVQDYVIYVQDELATDMVTYLTKLSKAGCVNGRNEQLVLAMIGQEVIYGYDADYPEMNCIDEDQFCSVVAYIQKVIRQ
jgi:hypothetical protein